MRVDNTKMAIDISMAVKLIEMGARLQLLEHEFPSLSRERLLDLYKEILGKSPPKGMLPFSSDWFLTWQPSVHSALFFAYYQFFKVNTNLSSLEILMKAYDFYLQDISRYKNHNPDNLLFSITRAWTMLRLMSGRSPLLMPTDCKKCGGVFIVENKTNSFYKDFVCGLCSPPARAGKTSDYTRNFAAEGL